METYHPDNLYPPEPPPHDGVCENCEDPIWTEDCFHVLHGVYVHHACVHEFLRSTYDELLAIRRRADALAKRIAMGMS